MDSRNAVGPASTPIRCRSRNIRLWIALLSFALICAAQAYAGSPCCAITRIDPRSGLVTARDNASGRSFEFTVKNPADLKSLRVGQAIFANFAAHQVSFNGKATSGNIVSAMPAPFQPVDGARASAAPASAAAQNGISTVLPASPCCSVTAINRSTGMVTAQEKATGRSFQFTVNNPSVLNALRPSQGVFANFSRQQVSFDGKSAAGSIVSIGPSGFQPVDGARASAAPVPFQPVDGARISAAPVPFQPVDGTRASAAPAPLVPCCGITAINRNTGMVTAQEKATGRSFQFTVTNPALLNSLSSGQGVFANFSRQQVSFDGKSAAGSIVRMGPTGFQPVDGLRSSPNATGSGTPPAADTAPPPPPPQRGSGSGGKKPGTNKPTTSSSSGQGLNVPGTVTPSEPFSTEQAIRGVTAAPGIGQSGGTSSASTTAQSVQPIGASPTTPPANSSPAATKAVAAIQPSSRISTIPNMTTIPLDSARAGALRSSSFTVTAPCQGSFQASGDSLQMEVDAASPVAFGDPFPGCTMTTEFYKGIHLQNGWSVSDVTYFPITALSQSGNFAWISKPSGTSPQGQISLTVPKCDGNAGPGRSYQCATTIIGEVHIDISGPSGSDPYPKLLFSNPTPAVLARATNPSGSNASGSSSPNSSSSGSSSPGSSSSTSTPSTPNGVCAGSSTLEGVDVSSSQGSVDWKQVRSSGRMFAYAKTSLGTSHADPSFANNYAAIKAAGLIRGAYHTFDATVDGAAQADYFLARLGTLPQGDLPPALDVEPQGTLYTGQVVVPVSTMLSGINAWMTHVKAATGRTPVILSSRYVLDQFGSDISGISSYPLWVYGINVSCPSLPSAWQKWALWDYSGTGKVPGITGIVDLVKFNGTQANLKSLQ